MSLGGAKQRHSSAYRVKQSMRLEAPIPRGGRVLETFAGEGGLYRGVWCRFPNGACVDNVAAKVAAAARMRPTWACYQGDAKRFLSSGMLPFPWDVVDIDAYGEPWPFARAWLTSGRPFAEVTHLFLTDGYRKHRNLAPPSRCLFPRENDDARIRKQARRAVERAIAQGKIPAVETVTCAVPGCGRPGENWHHSDYSVGRWLDVVPLCWDCHGKVHGGLVADPGRGETWEPRQKLDLTADAYDEIARARMAEWASVAGATVIEVTARAVGNMRYSYWRVNCPGGLPSLAGAAE